MNYIKQIYHYISGINISRSCNCHGNNKRNCIGCSVLRFMCNRNNNIQFNILHISYISKQIINILHKHNILNQLHNIYETQLYKDYYADYDIQQKYKNYLTNNLTNITTLAVSHSSILLQCIKPEQLISLHLGLTLCNTEINIRYNKIY